MVDFNKALSTAQRLINENGRSVTFVDFDSTLADPSKPWKGPADARTTPDAELTTTAVFVQPSSQNLLGRSDISQDLIKRSEQIMIVSPGGAVDLSGFQEVVDSFDSSRWKIVGIETLKPATISVVMFVGVKR